MAQVEGQQPESVQQQQELITNGVVGVEAFRSVIEAVGTAMEDLSNTVAEQQHEQIQPVEQYDNVPSVEGQQSVEPVVEQTETPQETQLTQVVSEETQKIEEPTEVQPIVTEEVQKSEENVEAPVEVQPLESSAEVQKPVESKTEEEVKSEEPQSTEAVVDSNEQSTVGEIVVIPVVNDFEAILVEPVESVETQKPEAPKAEAETTDEVPDVVDQVVVQEDQAVVEQKVEEGEVQGDENLSDSEENADMEEYYRQVQAGECEYADDEDLEDVSLNDLDSLDACSDTSSQKIKKAGKVRSGFRQVFSGTKQIFVGSGKNIKKGTSRTANKGRDTIKGGANFIADGVSSGVDSTINAGKYVGGAIKDGTVTVAKATAGAVSDVASGTKDVITTGVCLGVGATVLGAQAIGRGTTAVAGAIKDGTVSAATSVADGAKAAGGAVVDGVKYTGSAISNTASDLANAGKDAIGDVVDTGRSGVRAVEHGVQNAAMKTAASIQQGAVKSLTLGLRMADGSLTVVPKSIEAIEAPAAPYAIEEHDSQNAIVTEQVAVIALPPPENN